MAAGGLIKRVPGMRSIRCIVRTDKAAGVLRGPLPGLSTRIAHGTELDIELDTRMSWHSFILVSRLMTCCRVKGQAWLWYSVLNIYS